MLTMAYMAPCAVLSAAVPEASGVNVSPVPVVLVFIRVVSTAAPV